MKSFKQFLEEEQKYLGIASHEDAPRGVIFHGDKKVFVGKQHGAALKLSQDLIDKIKAIGNKYGYWWEGTGGDISTTTGFSNKKDYEGSWDDEFIKTQKGYDPAFLYTLFTNTNVNKQKEYIPANNMTIFESIMKLQTKIGYMKDRKFDAETLTKFLRQCSEDDADFVQMSKLPATKENVNRFLDKGEKLMWPEKNWEKYPNRAGKLAEKIDILRNEFLINAGSGVYFAGSGHLTELKKLLKSKKASFIMIGGEDAAD